MGNKEALELINKWKEEDEGRCFVALDKTSGETITAYHRDDDIFIIGIVVGDDPEDEMEALISKNIALELAYFLLNRLRPEEKKDS